MNYAQPDASDAPPSELTEFAYDIAQSMVINHKDKDVRLLGACAIAEVLRICAPKPPYDDEQLKVSIIVWKLKNNPFCLLVVYTYNDYSYYLCLPSLCNYLLLCYAVKELYAVGTVML